MDGPLGKIAMGGSRQFIIPGAANDKASCEKQCKGVQVENDCYGGWSCKVSNSRGDQIDEKMELFRNGFLKRQIFSGGNFKVLFSNLTK